MTSSLTYICCEEGCKFFTSTHVNNQADHEKRSQKGVKTRNSINGILKSVNLHFKKVTNVTIYNLVQLVVADADPISELNFDPFL